MSLFLEVLSDFWEDLKHYLFFHLAIFLPHGPPFLAIILVCIIMHKKQDVGVDYGWLLLGAVIFAALYYHFIGKALNALIARQERHEKAAKENGKS